MPANVRGDVALERRLAGHAGRALRLPDRRRWTTSASSTSSTSAGSRCCSPSPSSPPALTSSAASPASGPASAGPASASPTATSRWRRTASRSTRAIDADRLEALAAAKRYKVERMAGGRRDVPLRGPLPDRAARHAADPRRDHRLHPLRRRQPRRRLQLAALPGRGLDAAGVRRQQPEPDPGAARDSYAEFAPNGLPLDYRADLTIYERGEEVKRCSSTVNSPCSYNGYRFYQEAYFGYGAALTVRDTATGNVVYQRDAGPGQQTPRRACGSPTATARSSSTKRSS